MQFENPIIQDHKLLLPQQIVNALKWKYPFHRIPKLDDYNDEIIRHTKANNTLPYYLKFDINNDGVEEIILVQKALVGGFGRLLIISSRSGRLVFKTIKWNRPMNAQFFDYMISKATPNSYARKGLFKGDEAAFTVSCDHLITHGHERRVVYWDGNVYCQEKVGLMNIA